MKAIIVLLLVALAKSSHGQAAPGTAAANQLAIFKNSTIKGPIGILTLTTGRPVNARELDTVNTDLITNGFLLEQLSALARERIPPRIAHSKAAGAFGYLNITHDVTHITNVAFADRIGKITPMVARIGMTFNEKGSADTQRGTYAMAAKFYTEEGNWDYLGFSTDVFSIKDPVLFPTAVRISLRNPKTQLPDPNMLFDFLSQKPEAWNLALQFLGERGIPASYRHLETFIIHTFQVENHRKEITYVRFRVTPDLGVKNMTQSQATQLAGTRPDYFGEDLYQAIATGNFPTYTLGWQYIAHRDVKKVKFDIFDVTLRWPERQFPVHPIGKIVLNRNPEDHFRDIEQLALSPANLVPGMQGLDTLWKARLFAYRDAQMYRLGVNFPNIEVNRPLNRVYTFTRDGHAPVRGTFGGAPNYYPNSFNGPVAANNTRTRTKRTKVYTDPAPTNARQIADYYHGLPEPSRQTLLENLGRTLTVVYPEIRARVFKVLGGIDARLKRDVEAGYAKVLAASANASDNAAENASESASENASENENKW